MELLSMGGYGAYVWTSFALTFGVIMLCVLQGRRRHRQVYSGLRRRFETTVERHK